MTAPTSTPPPDADDAATTPNASTSASHDAARTLPASLRTRRLRARVLVGVVATPIVLWVAGVLIWGGGPGGTLAPWRLLVGVAWLLYAPFVLARHDARGALLRLGLPTVSVALPFLSLAPSSERSWEPPASRTAWATFEGSRVTIHDVRNFRHDPDGRSTPGWYDATYDLDDLVETSFVLTSFGGVEGMAHVMVSFRFSPGAADAGPEGAAAESASADRFVVMSAEVRREDGERYDPMGGLFRQYELQYVVADERDAIALRTLVHRDPTWVIPMNAGAEKNRAFFVDMIERLNHLHEFPEWYHTLFNSCATALVRHYERVNDIRLGVDRRIFLPGFSDALLEELDLLPAGMDRDAARAHFQVNERALADGNSSCFSLALRGEPVPAAGCATAAP